MNNQEKRVTRGVRIYIALSVIIVVIGIRMMIFDQHAFGYLEGKAGNGGNVDFSGFQVIVLGVLMLLMLPFIYWDEWKERRSRRKNNNT